MKYLVCKIGNEEYAIDIRVVLSIEKMQKIYQLPLSPSFVPGVIRYRGQFVTVAETHNLLELKHHDGYVERENQKIVIVQHLKEIVGFIVDCTVDIMEIDRKGIRKSENKLVDMADVNERTLLILKLSELFAYAKEKAYK
ncbi:MAG: chemotaxis protein CheW [Bacillaceae bacterium]|nr:chemotaxis protein CheW [Bacillaceae bacterium]